MLKQLSHMSGVRVSVASQMDPERMAKAPIYNVYCKTDKLADEVEEISREENWVVTRTGPQNLWINPTPDFVSSKENMNYSSVWDD